MIIIAVVCIPGDLTVRRRAGAPERGRRARLFRVSGPDRER